MRSWLSDGSGYGLRRDREQVRNLMTNFCKNVQLLCVCVLFWAKERKTAPVSMLKEDRIRSEPVQHGCPSWSRGMLNAGRLMMPMDRVVVVFSRQPNNQKTPLDLSPSLSRLVSLVLARRGYCCRMLAVNVKGIPITCRVITFSPPPLFLATSAMVTAFLVSSLYLFTRLPYRPQLNSITNYFFWLIFSI